MWPFSGGKYIYAISLMEQEIKGPFYDEGEASGFAAKMQGGRVIRSRQRNKWQAFSEYKNDSRERAERPQPSQEPAGSARATNADPLNDGDLEL